MEKIESTCATWYRNNIYIYINKQMDYKDPKVKRTKKSDKAKESYERNGGFSKKHIRLTEARKTSQPPEKK